MTIVQMKRVDSKKEIIRAIKRRYRATGKPIIKNWIRNTLVEGENKIMSRNIFLKLWDELREKGELKEAIVKEKGRIGWLPTQRIRKSISEKLEPISETQYKKASGLLGRVFVAISERPEIEYNEVLWDPYEDYNYPVSWKGKIHGAVVNEDGLTIQAKLDESEIPEKRQDEMYEEICTDIYERISNIVPEIKKTRVMVVLETKRGDTLEYEFP